jgi:hypothetical protein
MLFITQISQGRQRSQSGVGMSWSASSIRHSIPPIGTPPVPILYRRAKGGGLSKRLSALKGSLSMSRTSGGSFNNLQAADDSRDAVDQTSDQDAMTSDQYALTHESLATGSRPSLRSEGASRAWIVAAGQCSVPWLGKMGLDFTGPGPYVLCVYRKKTLQACSPGRRPRR